MNDAERALSNLGLAFRAGKVQSGDEGVMKAIRSGSARLVIVATDASDNAMKKYRDKCEYYGVPLLTAFDRRQLGRSVGKAERVAVAVTDTGLSELVRKSLAKHAEVEFH